MSKLSWDEYFLDIMNSVSKRATCDRGRSGCVIVKDKRILVTGYVGSPIGLSHCDDVGHDIVKVTKEGKTSEHCVRTIHAEQNAICQAARNGVSIIGATLYCKMTPCRVCCMMIINCGIKRVVCEHHYHAGDDSLDMFYKAGVEIEIMDSQALEYGK